MSKFKKEYVYNVEEYSQDTRRYQITSNVKLTDEEVRNAYAEIEAEKETTTFYKNNKFNLALYLDWSNERFTDDEILHKIDIVGIYKGTEYGDDCQVDITGDFENDE